jgi:hypothetical protein
VAIGIVRFMLFHTAPTGSPKKTDTTSAASVGCSTPTVRKERRRLAEEDSSGEAA